MRCFSNLFMVRPHLLLLSFLNNAFLDLHDVNTPTKLLSRCGRTSNSNGVEDRGQRPPPASYVRIQGHYATSWPSIILILRMLLQINAKLTQAFTSHAMYSKIGPPISKNAPVPESRPPIQGLIFESCGLCPVPTTALNQIHDQTNAFITVSTENIKEQLHQPTVMNVSSHGAPPATAPTEPSSVHQMKTRSKSGIFKTKNSPDFVSLTSHALHAALFLCAPKGFKSAAKHPQWMAAMHDEMEALNKIVLGLLYHVHLLLILLVPNGFIESNIMLMARLKGLKHVWWLRVLLKFRVSIIPTHHPYVKELLTGGNCSNLWSGTPSFGDYSSYVKNAFFTWTNLIDCTWSTTRVH
ncbi:hypothetical protein Tco_0039721 [Tanacetum coccineum]